MPPSTVPADPGWDEDLTWLDRDPMTAEEREASLDRLCELDEGYREEDSGDFAPLTAEELAEIRQAAADELLAVKAATTGRRGPGQPGSAGVFPGESASPAAGFGPGMALDVLPGCAGLAAADPAYQKGVKYLLSTQRADGSWYVRSRAPKFQPFFESGFPYGHDQWISAMATGWAATALALAMN